MGPRQRCRGITPLSRLDEATLIASMGPRQRCRGIGNKIDQRCRRCALQWGRGSAAAELLDDRDVHCGRDLLQWGRGSAAAELPCSTVRRGSSWSLQWGRGSAAAEFPRIRAQPAQNQRFNGAAAALPRNYPCTAVARCFGRASMGPRQRCRGIVRLHLDPPGSDLASMGPRQRCRGIVIENGYDPAVQIASMGPRQRCRGIRIADLARASGMSLQWGRGSAAAELPASCASSFRALRFNGAAAALPRNWRQPRPACRKNSGFNGAAAALPRNFGALVEA